MTKVMSMFMNQGFPSGKSQARVYKAQSTVTTFDYKPC